MAYSFYTDKLFLFLDSDHVYFMILVWLYFWKLLLIFVFHF